MRFLGIDPGSSVTGYGVVERQRGGVVHIAHGTIRTPAGAPLSDRLALVHRGVQAAVAEYAPTRAVVERVFVSGNVRSALVLGQARGAILAALGTAGVVVDEISAREVKKAVTGMGAADKAQVQAMVVRLLSLDAIPAQDAADALAVALCGAQMGRLAALDRPPRRRSRPKRRLVAPTSRRPKPEDASAPRPRS